MTPDQSFARWVKVSLACFGVVFVYFLMADLILPATPHARIIFPVVQVAPQVSGQVTEVNVHNNQRVKAGDILFTLDPAPFELAVQAAQLALENAQQGNQQLDASITEATAHIAVARVNAQQLLLEQQRLHALLQNNSVALQSYEETAAQYQAAVAAVKIAVAQRHQLRVQRGDTGADNLALRRARNALQQAQLNLAYTQVRAEHDGIISNFQLKPGAYATASVSLAALVGGVPEVIADFREKSLSHLTLSEPATVTFDALPGQTFAARVAAVDAGTYAGQLNPSGNLTAPETSDRWVRDAQRQRIYLSLDNPGEALNGLPSGARATVQLYHVGGPLAWLGKLQIHFFSLLHFVY
ncbi:HlyD family secretion protein [Aestuariicella hydrocarbonica]|uniref:HlyD family secretion protein n=1 Tax=Pseudomaricurvus hydrocarbonicus TaxID=1470433 RepID=A0A9E5MGM3_9GAMM|nr:HlyD family secretion protein [Aestuariicella hydrocarbonica]NHO64866.1 HlyD family secretion protein [Aestuariicella hydrocarbonica]